MKGKDRIFRDKIKKGVDFPTLINDFMLHFVIAANLLLICALLKL